MELGSVFSLVQLILCFCACSVYTMFLTAIHTLKDKGFGPAWAWGFHMGTVSKAWDQKTVSSWRGFPEKKQQQMKSLGLIASENFISRAVMEVVGSCLTNQYSEGSSGRGYYGGNEFIDERETLSEVRRQCSTIVCFSSYLWSIHSPS